MYRFICAVAAAGVLAFASGCATVTGSTAQAISVETRTQAHDPIGGANCRLTNSKGTWFVTSPGVARITRSNDNLTVNCDKEGQPTGTVTAVSATRAAIFGNIIAGGVVGAVIDHSTGSAYEYPNLIRVVLGSTMQVGPPDLTGDGQAPARLAPVPPSTPPSSAKPAEPKPPEKLAIASPASTPARDPSLPARLPQVGDTWKYRHIDRWTNLVKGPIVHEVIAVNDKQVREYSRVEKGGTGGIEQFITRDPDFIAQRLSGMPEFSPYLQAFDALEKPGYWDAVGAEYDVRTRWAYTGQAVGKETISVPAGTFTATRVELTGRRVGAPATFGQTRYINLEASRAKYVLWYAPEVKRVVKYTRDTTNRDGKPIERDTYELVDYKLN